MKKVVLSLLAGALCSVSVPWANSTCYAENVVDDEFLREAETSPAQNQSGGVVYPPGVTEPGAANVTGPVYWYCDWQDQYVAVGQACVPFGTGNIIFEPGELPAYCFRSSVVIDGKEHKVVFCGKGLKDPYGDVGPGFIIDDGDPGHIK